MSCPECGAFVKSANLDTHLKEVHKIKHTAKKAKPASGAPGKRKSKAPKGGTIQFPFKWILVGIIVMAMVGTAFIIKPGSSPGPDGGNGVTPAECMEGKTLQVNFVVKLHLYVTDESVNKVNFTNMIPNDLGKDPIDGKACTRRLSTGSASEYNASNDDAIIHVQSPDSRNFTLGDFFVTWSNQTLGPQKVASYWTYYGWRIVLSTNGNVISDTFDPGKNPTYDYRLLMLAPDLHIDFHFYK